MPDTVHKKIEQIVGRLLDVVDDYHSLSDEWEPMRNDMLPIIAEALENQRQEWIDKLRDERPLIRSDVSSGIVEGLNRAISLLSDKERKV